MYEGESTMIETFEALGGTIVKLQTELEILGNQAPSAARDFAIVLKSRQLGRAQRGMVAAQQQTPTLPGFGDRLPAQLSLL